MPTNAEIEKLVDAVLRLAADDGAPEEIQRKATEAKYALWTMYWRLQQAINAIDGIVPLKAPGRPWTAGWISPPVEQTPQTIEYGNPSTSGNVSQAERGRRVMEIVRGILATGTNVILTKNVADQLRQGGDRAKALETAVGNILHRTGMFRRVRSGEYEYSPAEKVG